MLLLLHRARPHLTQGSSRTYVSEVTSLESEALQWGILSFFLVSKSVVTSYMWWQWPCAVNIHYNSLQYCQHVLLPVLSIFPGMWPPWLDIYVTTQPGPRQTYQDWEYKT